MTWQTDSPYRCPMCGKRLMQDLLEDDRDVPRMWHECWECDRRWPESALRYQLERSRVKGTRTG